MKIALVLNPASGGNAGGKQLPQVRHALSNFGIDHDLFSSRSGSHLYGIGKNLNPGDYDALVTMGGDGTHFHFLNGLLSAHPMAHLPALGIIPAGSGNSFAMDLGIFDIHEAIHAISKKAPRPVDLILARGNSKFYFVNLAGLGFVTDVAQTASRFKFLKKTSYLLGVFHRLLTLKPFPMEIRIDGAIHKGEFCFAEICNSQFTGGTMHMAPGAKIDDGFMDLILARPLSRKKLLRALPGLYKGDHVHLKEVSHIRAREIEIISSTPIPLLPDGELFGTAPAKFKIIKHGLRYLA